MFTRLVLSILPKTKPLQTPTNVDANTARLGRIGDDDPTYKAVVDHALAQLANDIAAALDTTANAARRISAADSAAGMLTFLQDLETRRVGWVAHREEMERKEKAA